MDGRAPKRDLLIGVYDPMTPVTPVLDQLREAGIQADAMDVLSALPLPGTRTERSIPIALYLITIIAGLVGIGVGILFAGGTAAMYPLMTGGKAIVAAPVVGIVSYETMMLGGIVITFLVMIRRIQVGSRARGEGMSEIEEGLIGVAVQVDRDDPLFETARRVLQEGGARNVRAV
jgi:hypothetical protein